MKLSLVIPVYNERKFFPLLFKKVYGMDFGLPKEIVVVDDFSTDGTREYIRENVEGLEGVKVIYHEKNKGKGAALHTAFAGQQTYLLLSERLERYDLLRY